MSYQEFKASLQSDAPLLSFNELQLALWHAGKGNWAGAHEIAQDHEGETDFDRLHAYLHRVEGDDWNAEYWYKRAGMVMSAKTIEEEFEMLMKLWG